MMKVRNETRNNTRIKNKIRRTRYLLIGSHYAPWMGKGATRVAPFPPCSTR
jgi:hypothetical protein